MAKELSPERKEKKRLREQKELERLLKEQQKPRAAGYFAYFILIIAVVYMADEITTQISSQMTWRSRGWVWWAISPCSCRSRHIFTRRCRTAADGRSSLSSTPSAWGWACC